jgi:hypothetical protein
MPINNLNQNYRSKTKQKLENHPLKLSEPLTKQQHHTRWKKRPNHQAEAKLKISR